MRTGELRSVTCGLHSARPSEGEPTDSHSIWYMNWGQVTVPDGAEVSRALGGGWELREEQDLVPASIKEQMQERTKWGEMIDADRIP